MSPAVDKRSEAAFAFKPIAALSRSDENRLSARETLAPGESKSIDLAVPYFALSDQAGRELAALRIDDELGTFREFWSANSTATRNSSCRRIASAMPTGLPGKQLHPRRPDPKTLVLMPIPTRSAMSRLGRRRSVAIQATDRMGYHKEAESMLDYFSPGGKDKPEETCSRRRVLLRRRRLEVDEPDGFVLWRCRTLQVDPR